MDVHHIMFNCYEWRKEHILWRWKHETKVNLWPSMVKQLLGSRRVTAVVMEFLATTRAGERPKVQDQAQEKKGRGVGA